MQKQGYIYKISSPATDKIYVGSTMDTTQRFQRHLQHYKLFNRGLFPYLSAFDVLQFANPVCTILEHVEFECRYELLCAEKRHILDKKDLCTNKNIPTQTTKQYYQANRESRIAKQTDYNKLHVEKIREYQKVYQKNYRQIKLNNII